MHAFRLDDPRQGLRDGAVPRARDRPRGRRDSALPHGLADGRRRAPAPAVRAMRAAPSGPLRAIAVSSASPAGSAVIPGAMGRPATLRDRAPIAAAGHSQPRWVLTCAMPANLALFGPSALKSRFTGSGADSLLDARSSLSGSPAQRLVTPRRPFPRIICVYYSERRQNRRYDFDKISANMPTLIHEA